MTVYWVVLAAVGYLVGSAALTDPNMNDRPMGKVPATMSARLFLGLAALVLVGVAGLRWGVGTDFFGYVRNYETYQAAFWTDLKAFDEPGAKGLALFVSHVWDDPAVFMFAASAITVGLMLWTITKYSTAIAMSYFLFIFVGSWHGSFNGVRQYLACAVIFAGHRFIVERKPMHYALVVALAASFHISAVAMLALYFVPTKRMRHSTILLLIVGAMGALYASDVILEALISSQEGFVVTDYTTRAVNLLRIGVAVAPVALYWTPGVETQRDDLWFYRNMAIVHGIVMLAASWSTYLARFGIYTAVFLTMAIPRLVDFPDRRTTAMVRVGVVLLYSVYWYIDVSRSESLRSFHWVTERMM